jgi:hypothetical protein
VCARARIAAPIVTVFMLHLLLVLEQDLPLDIP